MKYRVYSKRELEEILRNNGYELARERGTHKIYKNASNNTVTIPKSLNPMLIRRLIKENNLIEDKKQRC